MTGAGLIARSDDRAYCRPALSGLFQPTHQMSNLDVFTLAVAAGLLILAAAITLFARRSPLGDSPWYWVCMFSMAAAAALFVMDGKYARRQDHLENEYRYGTRTLEPGAQRALSTSMGSQGSGAEADAPAVPTSDLRPPTSDRLISLWPLRIAAICASLISAVMLIRRSRT